MGVGVVVIRILRAAHKPAHGGKVDKAAGGVGVRFVLADDAAHGTPALVDIVSVDEPLAAGAVGDLSRYIVKAGNAAQVAVGEAAVCSPAHQRDFQLVFGAAGRDLIHALQGLERSRQRFFVGALGSLRLAACALRVGGVGQHADHGVQVGVPGGGVHLGGGAAVFILFIGHGQPVVDLLHESLRILAAAGGDAAAVGACHAAHKAAVRGDRAAGVVGGDQAVFDFAAVAAHDAADVCGVCHLGGGVLAGAHVGRALHVQRNVVDRAALHGAAVAARNAADRAADDVDADDFGRVGVCAAANGALIGTLNQSTAVAANNAAQVAIFVHALGQVGFDRNRIFIARAADSADVLAHGAARRYGVGGGGKVGEVEGACFNLAVFDRTCVVTDQTAHLGSWAVQGHAVVITAQGNVLNDSILRMSGGIGGVLVDCGNAANGAGRTVNVNVQQSSAIDMSIVVSRDAASLAVSSSHMAADAHGIYRGPGLVAAGNAACVTAARIQRIGGCAAIIIVAVLNRPVVAARQTAHVLVINMDAARRVGDIADRSLVAACRTASLVVGGHAGRAGKGDFFVYASGTDSTRCTIHARYTADLAGAADLDSNLAAHAIANDRAQVIPRHAADGGDAIDLAGGFGQADGASIIPRRTADVRAAADGNARRRGRIGDAAVVDARDAAEIAVVLLLAAHGILHAAAGDRAVVDARQAARRHGVLHAAVVGAVLQRRIFRRIADDSARKVAVAGSIQRSQRNTVRQDIALLIRKIGSVAKAQDTQVLAAVLGICKGQRGIYRVIADNAAHVGVCINIIGVFQPGQRDRAAAAGQLAFRQGIARAKGGQQHAQGVGMLGVAFQCAAQRLGRNDPVIADDAAHDAVGHDLVRVLGRRFRGRRVVGSVHKGKAVRRQVGTNDAAHKVGALDAVCLDLHGRQPGGTVQADETAHAVPLAHDDARHAKTGVLPVFNDALGVVVTGHAAHIVVAVQHGTHLVIVFIQPGDLAPRAVVAGDAAHKIRVAGRAAAGLAQLFQAVERSLFDVGYAVHFVRVIEQNGIVLRFVGRLHAPGGIVDAGNAAHVGCILAKARHQARVGHVGDGAARAVDRDNAAHIAVAEDIAVVGAAGRLQVAAHKAARQAAHKGAAQHDGIVHGGTILHADITGKAHQAAHKVAFQGAGLFQRAVRIIARLQQGRQHVVVQPFQAGAGAVFQRQVAGIACNAAKELAQHRAFSGFVAVVVGPGHYRAFVVQAGDRHGGIVGRGVQVACHAAHKAVAHNVRLVGHGRQRDCLPAAAQFGDVQHTGHAADAHGTPQNCAGAAGCDFVVSCFFCRIFADGRRNAGVVFRVGILQAADNGYFIGVDVFLIFINLADDQVFQLRPVFGHGNADDAAKAMRLVYRGIINAVGADGLVAERDGRHDACFIAARALDGAIFQAARVQADERADCPDLAAVGRVGVGQRLQVLGVVRVDGHGVRRLAARRFELGIDQHVRVVQGDIGHCAVVFTHQANIVVVF